MKPIRITNFAGGVNFAESTTIADNQLAIASNMYYDNQGILSTRKGIQNFGANIVGGNGQQNIYFTKFSTGTRHLLLVEGGNIRKYNEGTGVWDILKSGLSASKCSIITYRDYVYISNGIDNFMSYNGTAISEHAGNAKVKFLAVDKDVCYGAGVSTDPQQLWYTNAGVELRSSNFNNNEYIDRTSDGVITGLGTFNGLATVGTSKGVYMVNVFGSSVTIDKADYNGDIISNDSIENVENDQMFMSSRGMYSLAQRKGTQGSYRADSFSTPVQKIMDRVEDKSTASVFYWKKTSNVYVAVNDASTRNNTLLVYSVLMSNPSKRQYVWTTYENINANDFCEYEDANGDKHLLVANAFGGQTIEIETGYDDNGVEILSIVRSKTFDFSAPELLKTFKSIDIGGLTSKSTQIDYILDIDGTETAKTFTGVNYSFGDAADDFSLGEQALGEEVLGGGAVSQDGITYFPFIRRRYPYQAGYRVAIELRSNTANSPWKFTKVNIDIEPEPIDMFNNNYIS